ncbi:MAG TPA: carboxypeptidase-like regulatory domain-containing protein [Vicinamibacterales bacterium]
MKWLLPLLVLVACGCGGYNPEAGMSLPKDPGSLIVQVLDQDERPVSGVWVYVEMPNNIGSTFQEGTPTRADGTAMFYAVPSGTRRVEIRPVPAGFSAGPDGVMKNVDVLKGQTVTTRFVLHRDS